MSTPTHTNRLANETSPYLLQHANNPVDWYPWSDEAIEKARAEDKPIFLSIGYSACHWCHVMEHESFENEAIATVLNRDFVCIKVDREERPDLDSIYMASVQLLTGRGGWPMSVFLTTDLQPFYGGTYWPPTAGRGMPGFDQILTAVMEAWNNRRDEAIEAAGKLTDRIRKIGAVEREDEFALARGQLLMDSAVALERGFDFTNGGFGSAPKFPHAMNLQQLLRVWHRTQRQGVLDMVRLNLDKMATGGIYDQLAGGFARYSVDARWLVPHFEKMLYDNALLTSAYLDGFVATGHQPYAQVAEETLDYVITYLTDEQGGFHSTEDADSEGEEGKFYVWSPGEIKSVLGEERAERFCYVYDVTENGNFEGHSILNLPKSIEQCAALKEWDAEELAVQLKEDRETLLKVRDKRIRPGKDDKILVNWNGLMIDAMARGGQILSQPRFVVAAANAANFILEKMQDADGRLLHCFREGRARFQAYLDDYACLANGLVSLYEATFDERWIDEAVRLVEIIRARFKDDERSGFFYTADDHEELIARQKDFHDSSVPSGNGMAATVLTRLGKLCGRADFLTDARGILDVAAELMEKSPSAAGQLLIALDMQSGPFFEVAVLGDPEDAAVQQALSAFWSSYIPNRALTLRSSIEADGSPHLDGIYVGKQPLYGSPTVFVCQKFTCGSPVSGKEAAIEKWRELVTAGQKPPE